MKTSIANSVLNGVKKNIPAVAITLSLMFAGTMEAQAIPAKNKASEVSIVADPIKQKIKIEVNQGAEICNILVLVVDETGKTIYMDDRSHHKGIYKNEVDLGKKGKGMYALKIIADHEEINQKVVLR
jgi:hypothetical protein